MAQLLMTQPGSRNADLHGHLDTQREFKGPSEKRDFTTRLHVQPVQPASLKSAAQSAASHSAQVAAI